jgi:hypothetical protein
MSDSTYSIATEIPIALSRFCEECGITDITAWRWRKRGWLTTTNIAGRQYVMPEDIKEFKRRARDGEFAKNHKTPHRTFSESQTSCAE